MSVNNDQVLQEIIGKMKQFKNTIAESVADQIAEDTQVNLFHPNNKLGLTPLAPSTVRKKGHDHILIDTTAMANSITSKKTSDTTAAVGIPDDQAEIIRYARLHELGIGGAIKRSFLGATATRKETHDNIEAKLRAKFNEIFRD